MRTFATPLNDLMRLWPGVVFHQRPDFTIPVASSGMEALTGVSLEEWRREPGRFWQVVHEADVVGLQQQLKRAADSDSVITSAFRIRHYRTSRVAHLLEQREASRTEDGGLLGYEAVWLDVTRQTLAEARLACAAWTEALAALTTGLAHDFNNMMAGIHSLSEGFQAQLEEAHPFREGLALIGRNALQASQLLNRVVHLHRDPIGAKNYHALNELVDDMVALLRKAVPRRIQIETAPAKDPLPVYMDAVEFRRVLVQIALSAVDAIPNGGRLLLETSRHEQVPRLPQWDRPSPSAPATCLMARHIGTGISARQIGSIFDPSFTTGSRSPDSELAFEAARRFAERHGGAVSVEPVEHDGTAFRLWLPLADFNEAEREPVPAVSRRHTLLLLGAHAGALDATARVLREHGFHVVPEAAAERALELIGSLEYEFSGVVFQATAGDPLPGWVFEGIGRQRPGLKKIVQLVGCNREEVRKEFLAMSDLVIPAEAPAPELATRLTSILGGPPPSAP